MIGKNNNDEKILGVIGGVGPLSSVYFTELIVNMTDTDNDQGHLNMIIAHDTSIPDRTKYLLGQSDDNPLPHIIHDIKLLENSGASCVAIICNTAHHFSKEISEAISIPFINMIEETVKVIDDSVNDINKIGILATTGTIAAEVYQKAFESSGYEIFIPNEKYQEKVMYLIYDCVKAGNPSDPEVVNDVLSYFRKSGCQALILGCTELSVIRTDLDLYDDDIYDAMEILAQKCIKFCGKKLVL